MTSIDAGLRGAGARAATSDRPAILTPGRIIKMLIAEEAERHGATLGEVMGPSRGHRIVKARDAAIRRIHDERPDFSYPHLGRVFGGRDHTTILHSLDKTGGRGVRTRWRRNTIEAAP